MYRSMYRHCASLGQAFAFACAVFFAAVPPAFAVGGGTPDPSTVPVLHALRVQLDGLGHDFDAVAGIIGPNDLPVIIKLADELARMDAQLALAAVGGGSPDPSGSTLNSTLLALRAEAVSLRKHVDALTGKVRENPSYAAITKVLRFMQAASRMVIARIDYALPAPLTPPSDL